MIYISKSTFFLTGTVVSQPPGMPSVLSTLFGGAGKPGPINPVGPPMPPPVIDINSLLDKLVTSGIIKKEADTKPDDSEVSTSSDTKQEPQSEFALKKKASILSHRVCILAIENYFIMFDCHPRFCC